MFELIMIIVCVVQKAQFRNIIIFVVAVVVIFVVGRGDDDNV